MKHSYIDDLSSENQDTVTQAVEALCATDLRPVDEDCLIEIVRDFQTEETIAPLWAMVVLKRHASLASVPELLTVLDSDYDYYCEAAAEALISIARAHPDATLDLLEDFIWDRINHDPWDARLFAYEPVAALKDNQRAKTFLIRMFGADDQWRASLANDLAGFSDRRVLVLIRRALEFAERTKDRLDQNELRYAYARLAGAPIRQFDNAPLWQKPWAERWSRTLENLGEDQDADEESPEIERVVPSEWNDKELLQEIKQEQEVLEKLPLEDFTLRDYLAIREWGDVELKFDEVLRLLGLDSDWTVEKIQTLINASSNPMEAVDLIVSSYRFALPSAIETFASLLEELWNETPREEFCGLSPKEMEIIPTVRAENERINKKQDGLRTTLDVPGTQSVSSAEMDPTAERNDPCPCGSGKKFKKCYLANDQNCALLSKKR